MKEIINFLTQLKKNNNREWFHAHKNEFADIQNQFNIFAERLLAGIAEFDETVSGCNVKECTYRIYRDTRFSADKRPYKCHLGVFVCPHGKKSGYAGYYFQIGAEESGYPDGNMLASGNYRFDPEVLHILREDISLDNRRFGETLEKAPLFILDDSDMMKRVPRGYPKDAPYSALLKYRTYCLIYEPGKQFMLKDNLLERTLDAFRTTKPFVDFINRAVSYVTEERLQR